MKYSMIKVLFYEVCVISVLLFMLVIPTAAQVSIAPTTLFVHENPGVGELYLTNTSPIAQEIGFGFEFGYPSSTEEGEIKMVYNDTLKQQKYGLSDFVRLYPSRVVIPPNQSQTIRIQVLPMRDRPDGVFWSRLLVESSALTPDVENTNTEGISANFNYILEQSIPLFYRKGQNSTGIEVKDVAISKVDSVKQLEVIPEMMRTGNSPYLGMMYAKLYDSRGELIEERESPAYFYFKDWRKFTFSEPDASKGPFRLSFAFETKRQSMSARDLVQAEKKVHSITLFE